MVDVDQCGTVRVNCVVDVDQCGTVRVNCVVDVDQYGTGQKELTARFMWISVVQGRKS